MACNFFLIYIYNQREPLNLTIMPRMIYDYTKSVLERVSFDPVLFCKELRKALKNLLPYELEQLRKWLQNYTTEKPELRQFISIVS